MERMNAEKANTGCRGVQKAPVRLAVPPSIALLLVGCGAGNHLNSSSQPLVTHNRLASNRLAANRLPSHHLSSNRLASDQLSQDMFNLTDTDLIETDDGREVLIYIISCAISADVTLVGTDSGGSQYEFFGELGIAPQWLDHPLDAAGERWVSACLFARVNGYGVAVPISLRGPNSALTVSPEEQAGWTLQEGAFYGNYFTPPDEPINWIACRGVDSEQAHLRQRDCAVPDPLNPGKTLCGFNFAGDCDRYFREPTPRACEDFSSDGYYIHCADDAIFTDGGDPQIFDEVITTYVQP